MSVVENHIARFNRKDKKLLLACSGGIESVGLFHALKSQGSPFAVLHVNYHLRGEDSDADEQFVRKICSENAVPFRVFHCPTEQTKADGKNLQSEARAYRRKLFDQWTAISKDHFVVLAHHNDDQIETFFLQYFRGSGSFGLAGMDADKRQLLRPLLGINKDDIRNYAQENRLQWREDKSNATNNYLRNLFRNMLIPELTTAIPGLQESILFFQEKLRMENAKIENENGELIELIIKRGEFTTDEWKELGDVGQLLLLRQLGLESWVKTRVDELRTLKLSAEVQTATFAFYKGTDKIFLRRRDENEKHWEYKILKSITGDSKSETMLCCSSEILERTLMVRNAQQNDKILLKGMKGRKSVWDLLKSHGVPQQIRSQIPVFECDGEIVWIPEFAVSDNPFVKNPDSSTVYIALIEKIE